LKDRETNFPVNSSRAHFCRHQSFIQPTFQQVSYKLM